MPFIKQASPDAPLTQVCQESGVCERGAASGPKGLVRAGVRALGV